MENTILGPLGYHKQHIDALQRKAPDKLREANIIADDQATADAVQRKGAQMIAGGMCCQL